MVRTIQYIPIVFIIFIIFSLKSTWYCNLANKYDINTYSSKTGGHFQNLTKSHINVNKKHTNKFVQMFNYLHSIKAFVVDIDLLNNISKDLNETNSTSYLNFTFNKRYLQTMNNDSIDAQQFHLTFGLFQEENNLTKILMEPQLVESNCLFLNAFDDRDTNSTIFLNCVSLNLRIQLTLFTRRGYFLWINSNLQNHQKIKAKWFGDVSRSMSMFNLTTIQDTNGIEFYIPSSISRFRFDYKHSKFIECNRALADRNKLLYYNHTHEHKIKIQQKHSYILKSMSLISETFESLEKSYYLSCGTMIGWYRDCGLSPHVNDVDFSLFIDEYDDRVMNSFLGTDKKIKLLLSFGRPQAAFEMRLNNEFQYDLFFIYKENKTHLWVPYYERKYLYRQWIQPIQLCTGEMYGHRFLVLCNPEPQIEKDYGKTWHIPVIKFKNEWSNVDYKHPIEIESNNLKYYNQECYYKSIVNITILVLAFVSYFVYFLYKFFIIRFPIIKYTKLSQQYK